MLNLLFPKVKLMLLLASWERSLQLNLIIYKQGRRWQIFISITERIRRCLPNATERWWRKVQVLKVIFFLEMLTCQSQNQKEPWRFMNRPSRGIQETVSWQQKWDRLFRKLINMEKLWIIIKRQSRTKTTIIWDMTWLSSKWGWRRMTGQRKLFNKLWNWRITRMT